MLSTLPVTAACLALGRTTLTLDVAIGAGLPVAALVAPPLGVVALLVGSLVSPLAIPTGTHTRVPYPLIAIPLLTGAWVASAVWRRDLRVLTQPAVVAVIALGIAAAAALVLANIPAADGPTAPLAAQLGGLSVFLASAAAVILAADGLRDPRWLGRVVWVYLAFTVVLVGFRAMPESSGRVIGYLSPTPTAA